MIYILVPTTKGRRERLDKCIASIKESVCSETISICIYENSDGGWVKALRTMLVGFSDDAVIFNIGDDSVIETDCIQKLWDAYTREGADKLYQPYEQINEGNISTSPFCSAKYLRNNVCPEYIHHFADTEMTDIAKETCAYVVVTEAKMKHEHFSDSTAPFDETYDVSQKTYEKDQSLYVERKKNRKIL